MEENQSNYSYETSLPAYQEDQQGKDAQAKRILAIMKSLGGKCTIKQIEELIHLPQSTVSGRMKDLREAECVVDTGELTVYAGRKRKLFAIIEKLAPKAPPKSKPDSLFNYKKSTI